MSTFVLIVLAIICFVVWAIYKLIKLLILGIRDEVNDARYARRRNKEAEHAAITRARAAQDAATARANWNAWVTKTTILHTERRFISNRKYYIVTTFMVYYADDTREAHTVNNDSDEFDRYMSKLDT